MDSEFEAKLQREICKRAFERRDRLQLEKKRWQDIQHTLDALHEVTKLPQWELEAITQDVRLSFGCHTENFFSIKNQIFAAGGMIGFVVILAWLLLNI
jgi:hypothetical protein